MALPHAFTANLLRTSVRAYAAAVVEHMQTASPQALTAELPEGFARPVDDTEVRLLHLAESVAFDRPELLQHAMRWYKVALHHREVPPRYLEANLEAIGAVLARELPASAAAVVIRHVEHARHALRAAPVELPSELDLAAPHGELAAKFLLAVLEGRGDDAVQLLRGAIRGEGPAEQRIEIAALHDHVLTPVQRELGRMWLMREVPIADEHYGSSIVDRVLWALHDQLPRPDAAAPTVLTMGVGGNMHDFGLRMVAQRLQLAGLRVHHLGSNMPASDLEWALQERPFDLIAISATMILNLSTLAATVDDVRRIEAQRPQPRRVPILVGGEIFGHVEGLHAAIGADAAASDAVSAVRAACALLGR